MFSGLVTRENLGKIREINGTRRDYSIFVFTLKSAKVTITLLVFLSPISIFQLLLRMAFSGLYCSVTNLNDYQCQPASLI